jgi:hypothetical protein
MNSVLDALRTGYDRRKAELVASIAGFGRSALPLKYSSVDIACGEFQTEIPLPEQHRPWWVDFQQNGLHEPLATRTFIQEIDAGDTVWDMGSKYGYFAHIAAEMSGPENVHVFEANRRTYRTRLAPFNDRAWDGELSVVPRAVGATATKWQVSGDDYAASHGTPEFVKMDIEGAELPAVKGMSEVIRQEAPTLLIEVHPPKINQHWHDSAESLIDILSEHYEISVCWEFRESDSEWEPINQYEWRRRSPYTQYYQILCRE